MRTITITEELTIKARKMEQEVLLNLKKTPNYTGFASTDRYYIGFLGELVFEQLLIENGKQYIHNIKLDGNSQGADFSVVAYRGLSVEVKTSDHPNAQRLMIPEKQFNHRSSDLYIGIKIEVAAAKIFGYCSKNDFEFAPEGFNNGKIPTYFILFTRLYPIENLISKLK